MMDRSKGAQQKYMLVTMESFDATPGREYKIVVEGTVTMAGYAEDFSKTTISTFPSAQ